MTLTAEEVEKIKKAGAISANARRHGAKLLKEGAKLIEIAEELENLMRKEGAEPAFPCCLTLNRDAAHYTPKPGDETVLKKGDVVKLDLGAHVDGYIGDTAVTVEVGTDHHAKLISASQEALKNAIALVKPGRKIAEIGGSIEATIRGFGFKPIVNLTGHSIEPYLLHAGVSIPNVGRGAGVLEEGMVIAIEPFATDGVGRIKESNDGNICLFLDARPQRVPGAKALLSDIEKARPKLPFASRWMKRPGDDRFEFNLMTLVRSRAVLSYPVLREEADGMVSQAEHTIIVSGDGAIVTTA
ncbi:MAG: type II methionyl aminopeptidase [Euryarchaeota archaeon]|nr:type II methionyl aminopeptidase [Euryarchaeota archaeon]